MKKSYLLILSLCLFMFNSANAADNMKAFPPAEQGMKQVVITLDKQDEEAGFKVEIIIGKTVKTDPHNHYFFASKIEKQVAKGWGFSYYTVNELGPMAGTLMAVDPSVPSIERFIPLGGDAYLINYNSRLPVVIYVPEDAEVHYRIWSAGDDVKL